MGYGSLIEIAKFNVTVEWRPKPMCYSYSFKLTELHKNILLLLDLLLWCSSFYNLLRKFLVSTSCKEKQMDYALSIYMAHVPLKRQIIGAIRKWRFPAKSPAILILALQILLPIRLTHSIQIFILFLIMRNFRYTVCQGIFPGALFLI